MEGKRVLSFGFYQLKWNETNRFSIGEHREWTNVLTSFVEYNYSDMHVHVC